MCIRDRTSFTRTFVAFTALESVPTEFFTVYQNNTHSIQFESNVTNTKRDFEYFEFRINNYSTHHYRNDHGTLGFVNNIGHMNGSGRSDHTVFIKLLNTFPGKFKLFLH